MRRARALEIAALFALSLAGCSLIVDGKLGDKRESPDLDGGIDLRVPELDGGRPEIGLPPPPPGQPSLPPCDGKQYRVGDLVNPPEPEMFDMALDQTGVPRIVHVEGVTSSAKITYRFWDDVKRGWSAIAVNTVAKNQPIRTIAIALDDSDRARIFFAFGAGDRDLRQITELRPGSHQFGQDKTLSSVARPLGGIESVAATRKDQAVLLAAAGDQASTIVISPQGQGDRFNICSTQRGKGDHYALANVAASPDGKWGGASFYFEQGQSPGNARGWFFTRFKGGDCGKPETEAAFSTAGSVFSAAPVVIFDDGTLIYAGVKSPQASSGIPRGTLEVRGWDTTKTWTPGGTIDNVDAMSPSLALSSGGEIDLAYFEILSGMRTELRARKITDKNKISPLSLAPMVGGPRTRAVRGIDRLHVLYQGNEGGKETFFYTCIPVVP